MNEENKMQQIREEHKQLEINRGILTFFWKKSRFTYYQPDRNWKYYPYLCLCSKTIKYTIWDELCTYRMYFRWIKRTN